MVTNYDSQYSHFTCKGGSGSPGLAGPNGFIGDRGEAGLTGDKGLPGRGFNITGNFLKYVSGGILNPVWN